MLLKKLLNINEKFTHPVKKQTIFNHVKEETNFLHEEDYNLMADLLHLPTTDKGYKYLLVIVDLASVDCDFEPIKTKDAEVTLTAIMMKAIFKRKYIKLPYAEEYDCE
jgi:hypothetical protein